MWARKRIDIDFNDLAAALGGCLAPANRAAVQSRMEEQWSASGNGFACLSVRSGWDLLLKSAAFPKGSEVLVSSITIPDMVRIVEQHGLVPVPLDLDRETALPTPQSIAERTTPRTKAVLIAHLFGTAARLDDHIAAAHERGLLFVEDCAQAFRGLEYPGHPQADASMFSFGTIKTATALGGAMLTVRWPELLARMRELQSQYAVQSQFGYLRRVLKYCVLKALATRPGFGTLLFALKVTGRDHDRFLNASIRGFPADRLFELIRQQPCAALLKLLHRRLATFDVKHQAWRMERGQRLVAALEPAVDCPAGNVTPHVYWVFPILCDDPLQTQRLLFENGFDSTQGQSMIVVPPPQDRQDWQCTNAEAMLPGILYLPFYDALPEGELQRMARVLVGNGSHPEPAGMLQTSRDTR
jgi:dTDP-4-amino-4,6-dideoxygalactose transaminase